MPGTYISPAETGLYYLNSRYYDPETGRFINADDTEVLSLDQNSVIENNLFAYGLNNPVNMEDADGYAAANIVGGIIGGAVGAALGYALAKQLKLTGWKKWALISAATVGGAVLGAFLGPYVAKLGSKIIVAAKNSAASFKTTVQAAKTAIKHSKVVKSLIKNASKLKRTKTVMSHLSSRPYINSTITIQNIMKAAKPSIDSSLKKD